MFGRTDKNKLGISSLNAACSIDDFQFLGDVANRRLYLFGEIYPIETVASFSTSASVCADYARLMLKYNQEDYGLPVEKREPIWLFISSPGGNPTAGFYLIDAIAMSKTPVYTVNVGQCSSMAFLVAIAGHKRFSFPTATFLMHDGSIFVNGTTNKVKDLLHFEDRLEEERIKPYVLKHSKMSEKMYDKICCKEFYMMPEDAIKYGFIEGIIEDLDTFIK